MRYHHDGDSPVYAPNSDSGRQADPDLGARIAKGLGNGHA